MSAFARITFVGVYAVVLAFPFTVSAQESEFLNSLKKSGETAGKTLLVLPKDQAPGIPGDQSHNSISFTVSARTRKGTSRTVRFR